MSVPPANPKLYHITHIENLSSMLAEHAIQSDSWRAEQKKHTLTIGMTPIKQRRLCELEVHCHPGTFVGQYVPFYFCPRSIMLYILHMGNHPDIDYHDGQGPIVHLQSDVNTVIRWATENRVNWAFTDRNAGAYLSLFFNKLDELKNVDWEAVSATDFRHPAIKEKKQAEFLVHESFPFRLVKKIGVINTHYANRVKKILDNGPGFSPEISIENHWYF